MWLEVFRVTENMMPWPDFLANHNTGDLHGDVAFMSRGSGRFFNFSFSPVRLSTQPSSICLTCEVLVRSSRATASRSRRSTSPTCSGRPPARPSSLRTRPFQTTCLATAAATTTTAPATTAHPAAATVPACRPPTRWPGRTTPASATTGSTGSLRTRPPRRSSKSAEARPGNRWGEKRRQREGFRGWTATARRLRWPPPPSTPGSCRSCCQCTQPSHTATCASMLAQAKRGSCKEGWLLIHFRFAERRLDPWDPPPSPPPPPMAYGGWYHFPAGAKCPDDGTPVGTNGCTWRRDPRACAPVFFRPARQPPPTAAA